jgi:hypothetical protein
LQFTVFSDFYAFRATVAVFHLVLRIRIRIRTDPHHLAGSGILEADPDPDLRLQNWHLINFVGVEKYGIVKKFKYIYANFSVNK